MRSKRESMGALVEILGAMHDAINWNLAISDLVKSQERQAEALERIAKALEDGIYVAFGEDQLLEIEDTALRVLQRVGVEEVEV